MQTKGRTARQAFCTSLPYFLLPFQFFTLILLRYLLIALFNFARLHNILTQIERDALQEKNALLENQLITASERETEHNRVMNDFFTSQKENVNLNSNNDDLQAELRKLSSLIAENEMFLKEKEQEVSKEY